MNVSLGETDAGGLFVSSPVSRDGPRSRESRGVAGGILTLRGRDGETSTAVTFRSSRHAFSSFDRTARGTRRFSNRFSCYCSVYLNDP